MLPLIKALLEGEGGGTLLILLKWQQMQMQLKKDIKKDIDLLAVGRFFTLRQTSKCNKIKKKKEKKHSGWNLNQKYEK